MVVQVSELDRNAGIPLGTQLAWILRSRVASRALSPGERLPGAREMAALAGVNVNTVRSVYAKLEDEGLLDVVHGKGTFVSTDPGLADDAVAHLAAVVSAEAARRGVDPREVAAALYARPEQALGADPGIVAEGARLTRHAIRDQIAHIEQELAELQAAHPELVVERGAIGLESGARLLGLEELERSRDKLATRLEETRTEVAAALQNVRESRRAGAAAPASGPSHESRTTATRVGWRVGFES
jgi:GntR family transcriptional regulator